MTKHTIKGFIVHETWHGEGSGKYRFQEYAALTHSESYTQIPVCEHELTFDIPEGFDPRPGQIAALRETEKKVRAEFAARVTEIQAQISKLLCIENAA